MKGTQRKKTPARRAAAMAAPGLSAVLLALMLLIAAPSPGRGAVQASPRFASLNIDIRPEFDRPAALVILTAELHPDVALPAAVSLRIPASSGGPTAVAYADAPGTQLFNLSHDRIDGGGYITLRLQAPQRFLHIEFYDPLATSARDRSYTYTWPGDVAVDRLSVSLQEPVAAGDISVEPALSPAGSDADGLLYRVAELGAAEAGKQLPIKIRYTKTDSRTSAEILGKKAPGPTFASNTRSGTGLPAWSLILAVAAALMAGAGVASLFWWRRRGKKASGSGPGFCARCGGRLTSGARFCSACGATVNPSQG